MMGDEQHGVDCANCGRESLECDDDGEAIYQENAAAHIKHRISCTWGCGSFILASVEGTPA